MNEQLIDTAMFVVYLFIFIIVVDYFLNPPKKEGD